MMKPAFDHISGYIGLDWSFGLLGFPGPGVRNDTVPNGATSPGIDESSLRVPSEPKRSDERPRRRCRPGRYA